MVFGFLKGRNAGIRSRTDLLNHLVSRHGYTRYLEIGVRDPQLNFERVSVKDKSAVDPAPLRPISHPMTSDAFFAQRAAAGDRSPFDLIFVDGLHLAEQVERDIVNSLEALAPGGTLVLHDCNPLTEDAQTVEYDGKKRWNGTVWKAWVKMRATRADLSMWVVNMDEGCGIIRRGAQTLFGEAPTLDYDKLDYRFLARHRKKALNLVSLGKFLRTAG